MIKDGNITTNGTPQGFFHRYRFEVVHVLILVVLRGILYLELIGLQQLTTFVGQNDNTFYLQIITEGYGVNETMCFSPLFPALLFLMHYVIPLESCGFLLNTILAIFLPFVASKTARLISQYLPKPEEKQKIIALFLIYNPLVIAYSIYALSEMLFYVILLQIIAISENPSTKSRISESFLAILLVLTRTIGLLLVAYYAVKAFFILVNQKKVITYQLFQIIILIGTFAFSEFIVPLWLFDTTPSEMRKIYWGQFIGFDASPYILLRIVMYVGIIIAGISLVRHLWRVKTEEQQAKTQNSHFFEALICFGLGYIGFLFLYNILISSSRIISVNLLLPIAFFLREDQPSVHLKKILSGLNAFYWFFLGYQLGLCVGITIFGFFPELLLSTGLPPEFYAAFTSPGRVYYILGAFLVVASMVGVLFLTYYLHARRSNRQLVIGLFLAIVCFGQVTFFFA